MNSAIVIYLVVGVCFGLVTYSRRHLFSEGATSKSEGARDAADGRVMWVVICSGLWPILSLAGLVSVWRLSRVPARARRPHDAPR